MQLSHELLQQIVNLKTVIHSKRFDQNSVYMWFRYIFFIFKCRKHGPIWRSIFFSKIGGSFITHKYYTDTMIVSILYSSELNWFKLTIQLVRLIKQPCRSSHQRCTDFVRNNISACSHSSFSALTFSMLPQHSRSHARPLL